MKTTTILLIAAAGFAVWAITRSGGLQHLPAAQPAPQPTGSNFWGFATEVSKAGLNFITAASAKPPLGTAGYPVA